MIRTGCGSGRLKQPNTQTSRTYANPQSDDDIEDEYVEEDDDYVSEEDLQEGVCNDSDDGGDGEDSSNTTTQSNANLFQKKFPKPDEYVELSLCSC